MKEEKGSMIGDWINDHGELIFEVVCGAALLVLAGLGISKFVSKNEDTIDYFKEEDHMI